MDTPKNDLVKYTTCQNHLYIKDESQNFDEMRSVASLSPARGQFCKFSTVDLASSSTVHLGRRYKRHSRGRRDENRYFF